MYRALLERVNADLAEHTGKSISELEGLEDITKGNIFEFCQKILAGAEAKQQPVRIIKKSSTIGLTDEVEMVANPMSGKAAQV
ncbi:hypothetical protein TrLO_g3666 [Triparma laevis f. longispina]|uniref:Uncharacterized protein n=1 Tax=Triparma laevis f. longispina TaxID=1714387 RepID=A0A9W7FRB2_9STRA|nr:hypothetical protein TrLO_g3666 [Triparma laevis f. longispina]